MHIILITSMREYGSLPWFDLVQIRSRRRGNRGSIRDGSTHGADVFAASRSIIREPQPHLKKQMDFGAQRAFKRRAETSSTLFITLNAF